MEHFQKIKLGLNQLRKDCLFKECFHKDDNCDTKIIKAHSIQENKILKRISINGNILSFNSIMESEQFEIEMKEIGKAKASIFTGFCKFHDNAIFRQIEIKDYEKHNKEQEFLFAYRSLAWFYHAKRVEFNQYEKLYNIIRNQDEKGVQRYLNLKPPYSDSFIDKTTHLYKLKMEGALTTVKELEILRTTININLDKKKFHKIITEVIEFDNETPITVSSILYIEFDMKGNLINDYCNERKKLQPVFLSVFPQKGKTYILISYLKNNKNTFNFIDEQIINQPTMKQRIILSNIIICYVENFFISPHYWATLAKPIKTKINYIFNNTIGQVNKPLVRDNELNLFL